MQDELNKSRLSLTMTENRNNYLSQEIASLTIQLKNANRTIEQLRKSRDDQKRAMKQVLEMSHYKSKSEGRLPKQAIYEESSNVVTQMLCSRTSKSDLFVKDLEKILSQAEVAKTDSKDVIEAITSLIDEYYVTLSSEGRGGKETPISSHRRRLSTRKNEEKKTNRKSWTGSLSIKGGTDYI